MWEIIQELRDCCRRKPKTAQASVEDAYPETPSSSAAIDEPAARAVDSDHTAGASTEPSTPPRTRLQKTTAAIKRCWRWVKSGKKEEDEDDTISVPLVPLTLTAPSAASTTLPAAQAPPPAKYQRATALASGCFGIFKRSMGWLARQVAGGVHWTASHFLFPLVAPFRLIFINSNIIYSFLLQFGPASPIEKGLLIATASIFVVLSLLLLALVDGVIGIIRSFRGHKIYHNNVFNEYFGLINKVLLFITLFSKDLFYIGWIVGPLLSTVNAFGPQTKRGKMHLQTLPFLQASGNVVKYQLLTAIQRAIHIFIVFFSNLVSNKRLVSFILSQVYSSSFEENSSPWLTGGIWLGSTLWSALFTIVAVKVARLAQNNRSFLNLNRTPLFIFSAILVLFNIGKESFWEFGQSAVQVFDAFMGLLRDYRGCPPTACTNFSLGSNLSTALSLLFTGLCTVLCAAEGFSVYRKTVGNEGGQLEISPPHKRISTQDIAHATNIAARANTSFWFTNRASTQPQPSGHSQRMRR